MRVALDIDGERVARPYSLINTPDDEFLEIYFNVVPEGPLSPRLAQLRPGDELFVADKPGGLLTIDDIPSSDHLWMLATGTGIGPFLSILKTEQPWRQFEKLVLGYSVRTREELGYLDTIRAIQVRQGDRFVFAPFVSRETLDGAFESRITTAIDNGELEHHAGVSISATQSHVMLCGNAGMISDVRERLEARGLCRHTRREAGHISTEKYH